MTFAAILFFGVIVWLAALVVAITRRENSNDDREHIAEQIVLGPIFLGVILADLWMSFYFHMADFLRKSK
jgi:heme/copper-type cytochrome/quinol oxidase subunit 2